MVVGSTFDAAVTHVVVSVDKAGMIKKRTMKFMQGIMGGLWVLSSRWLADSVAARRVLPEDAYEVPGYLKSVAPGAPRRARLAIHDAAPPPPGADSTHTTAGHGDGDGALGFAAAPGFYVSRHPGNCLFKGLLVVLVGNFVPPCPPRAQLAALLDGGQAIVTTALTDFLHAVARRRDRAQGACLRHIVLCPPDDAAAVGDLVRTVVGDDAPPHLYLSKQGFADTRVDVNVAAMPSSSSSSSSSSQPNASPGRSPPAPAPRRPQLSPRVVQSDKYAGDIAPAAHLCEAAPAPNPTTSSRAAFDCELVVVSAYWVLDCVANFQQMPVTDFPSGS